MSTLSRIFLSLKKLKYPLNVLFSTIVPFDEEQAFLAAELKKQTKDYNFSLEERTCIALAQKMQIPIYTADKTWDNLQLESCEVIYIK